MNITDIATKRELRSLPPGSTCEEALKVRLHNCRLMLDNQIASARKAGNERLLRHLNPNGMGQLARSIRRYEVQLWELKQSQASETPEQSPLLAQKSEE